LAYNGYYKIAVYKSEEGIDKVLKRYFC